MKKNIAMRVAAFLFILTMISTCAFATTFAKYTTADSANDSARVAKWGVTVEATGKDLFVTDYDVTGGTVISADSKDVVAPGTTRGPLTFTLSGNPEVAVEVLVTADLVLSNWKIPVDDGKSREYCPLIITVDDEDFYIGATIDGIKIEKVEQLEQKVEEAITSHAKDRVEANQLASDTITISWTWEYTKLNSPIQSNEDDTALGDLKPAPTIELKVSYTVSQLN